MSDVNGLMAFATQQLTLAKTTDGHETQNVHLALFGFAIIAIGKERGNIDNVYADHGLRSHLNADRETFVGVYAPLGESLMKSFELDF